MEEIYINALKNMQIQMNMKILSWERKKNFVGNKSFSHFQKFSQAYGTKITTRIEVVQCIRIYKSILNLFKFERVLFPVGGLCKSEVRKLAEEEY